MIKEAKKIFAVLFFLSLALAAAGQADKRDVRAGNRKFRKGEFKEAEIDYRKAVLKDSTSMKAQYNLASSLYRQEDYEGAGKALSAIAPDGAPASCHFNSGDVALKRKDYASAVKAFRNALLLDPDDLDAKENYIYAKKMLQNQQEQQNGGGGQDENQDRNQDRNQDQNQDKNQDRQDQNQQGNQDKQDNGDGQQGQQQPQAGISPQQAQQMLKAVQAKEDETRSKVEKEKAALLQSRQKEKNW